MANGATTQRWRWATFGLAGVLVVSWAGLGYAILDGGVSLTHCRDQQAYQEHDITMLVEAARGRLSSDAFLAARAALEPELPRKLDDGDTLLLRTITLRFDKGGLLQGIQR